MLKFAQLVQDHEIAHTYFPFYMGINESRYAFMDEGWATTFELLIGRTEDGKEKAEEFYKQFPGDRLDTRPFNRQRTCLSSPRQANCAVAMVIMHMANLH